MPLAVVRAAIPAGTADIDITDPKMGGVIPKGFFVISAGVDTTTGEEAAQAGWCMGVGFCDGVNEEAFTAVSNNGASSSATGRQQSTGNMVLRLTYAGASITLSINSVGANGLKANGANIRFDNTGSATVYLTFAFIYGASAQCAVGQFVSSTATQTVGVGFDPDIVLLGTAGLSSNSATITNIFTVGVAVNDGSASQNGITGSSVHGSATAQSDCSFRSGDVGGQLYNNTFTWEGLVGFSTNAFTHISARGTGTGNDIVHYLAIKLDADDLFELHEDALPTSTGAKSFTVTGFQPAFSMMMFAGATTANTLAANENFGIGVADETQSGAVCSFSEDAVATMNEHSADAQKALYGIDSAGAELIDLSLSAFSSGQAEFTVNTPAPAAYKMLGLFVGQASAGSSSLTATPPTVQNATIGTPTISQNHVIGAAGLSAEAATVGTPAVGQVHVIEATGLDAEAATVGQPAAGQVHNIAAPGLAAEPATVGTPSVSETSGLVAVGITAEPATIGIPAAGQVHAVQAAGPTASAAIIGEPAISQIHALTVAGLVAENATIQTPALIVAGAGDVVRFVIERAPIRAIAEIGPTRATIQRAA